VVELHTGTYCEAWHSGPEAFEKERQRIAAAASHGSGLGLEIHAGHGLSFGTVKPIARIPELAELNIGHFLVGEAIFIGLAESVRTMRLLMDEARAEAAGVMPA
jgi:pyridoxine 5-phosphate synthase